MKKVYLMEDRDFADLLHRIELHYRKRAEKENQPWSTSFAHDDPRGTSIYDQFKSTWFELCRWGDAHQMSAFKAMNP